MQSKPGADCFFCEMDLENFITSLNKSYKESFIAMLCEFPLAYIDCWWVWDRFETLELFPQIIISLGITVILAGASGLAAEANATILRDRYNNSLNTMAVFSLYPTAVATALTILFEIRAKWSFVGIFLGTIFIYWLLIRIFAPRRK